MDNTGYNWTEQEASVCRLGLKFVPTVTTIDRAKKMEDFEQFANDLRLLVAKFDDMEEEHPENDLGTEENETTEKNKTPPWIMNRRYFQKPGDYPQVEEFINQLKVKLFNPANENYVKDNITKEQREALKSLSKWNADPENDRMFTVQDKARKHIPKILTDTLAMRGHLGKIMGI